MGLSQIAAPHLSPGPDSITLPYFLRGPRRFRAPRGTGHRLLWPVMPRPSAAARQTTKTDRPTRTTQFGCCSAALWGSQSWLPPASAGAWPRERILAEAEQPPEGGCGQDSPPRNYDGSSEALSASAAASGPAALASSIK